MISPAATPAGLNITGRALNPGAERAWWMREALDAENAVPCPPLDGNTTADVVIVGGGFTGLWTAYFLKELEPELGVCVLEQDICGGGPSGRNGGFASGWWDDLDGLVSLYGAEAAVRACRAITASIDAIGAFCDRHGVDAWYRRSGYVFAATGPRHELACEHMVKAAAEVGEPDEIRLLSARTSGGVALRPRSAAARSWGMERRCSRHFWPAACGGWSWGAA